MSRAEMTSAEMRHPWDWYVEEQWCTEALVHTMGADWFDEARRWDVVYDPCAGRCHIVDAMLAMGFNAFGSDIEVRIDHARLFNPIDFLGPLPDIFDTAMGRPAHIVFNPPYSQQDGRLVRGLAQRFVERALELATVSVCALLPLKWWEGLHRHAFLTRHVPRCNLIFSERPSMPPGDQIEALGARAWKRGKVAYCWVVWDKLLPLAPGQTRTMLIPPRSEWTTPPIDWSTHGEAA